MNTDSETVVIFEQAARRATLQLNAEITVTADRLVASYLALAHIPLDEVKAIHRGALVICEDVGELK